MRYKCIQMIFVCFSVAKKNVKLNIYDLSTGLDRQLSTMFSGKAIEAIW